jgi:Universal stress protein family
MQITDPAGPIVVGVSRRTGSVEAVRWAVAEAQLRHSRVFAVTAWRGPRPPAAPGGRPPALTPEPVEQAFAEEEQRIRDLLTLSLGDLDALGVQFWLRRGSASAVLLAAAAGAQLLVLDSPRSGRSTLAKSLIAPQVVFQAPCPVVLMPPPIDPAGNGLPARGLTAVPEQF